MVTHYILIVVITLYGVQCIVIQVLVSYHWHQLIDQRLVDPGNER